jgi:cytoskeletal protein RodZ
MESEKSKNMWIVVAVVVILAGLGLWMMNKNSAPEMADNSQESVEDLSEGSINASSPAASISYQNALVKYKNARLQLDKTCQASPDKMTFKDGTDIMVDNRAPVARTVKVGSVFPIKAYGFKIVRLSSATLPATWLVDCDKSQNVATILIQK